MNTIQNRTLIINGRLKKIRPITVGVFRFGPFFMKIKI